MEVLDGLVVREKVLEEIKNKLGNISKRLGIAIISIGDSDVNDIYVRQKEKLFTSLGINFRDIRFGSDIEESKILEIIDELNNDQEIDGIMVELPIVGDFDRDKILNRIDYRKDVDGLTSINRDKLFKGDKCMLSSTVEAILEIFKCYDIDLENKKIVIVGNGILVGKPLSILLKNNNYDVMVCDSKTIDLDKKVNSADIVVSCVGKVNIITSEMLRDNQIIIDVGVNVKEGKVYGDVDRVLLDEKKIYITPIKGGVGVVTVVSLVKNLIKCYEKDK